MAYDLGIVIPVYRSAESVKVLVTQLEEIFLPEIKIRICLVDDSGDGGETARFLRDNCLRPRTALAELDGNYGQQAALLCGLKHVGPCRAYATIDDDLEQPPQMVRMLYERVKAGCDLAYGIPLEKQEKGSRPSYRVLGSRMRDGLFSKLIGVPEGIKVSSLRVMKPWVVREALSYPRTGFFYLSASILKSVNKKGKDIKVENLYYSPQNRLKGKSGYTMGKLLELYGRIFWHYGLGLGKMGKPLPLYRLKSLSRPEKLLLLGGSNCQLHGAERASAMNLDTVLADYTRHPPAADVCGLHRQISTFDVVACVQAAEKYHVTGVMTMGTDQPVYTAACVCKALGLPCDLTEEQAFSVTNKKRMKQLLTQAGIPTAKYRIVNSRTSAKELEDMRLPFVLKPLDSQGQRGIYKLWSPKETLLHLDQTLSFSRCEEALAEEFYDSDEVTVSGWLADGNLSILTVTDRLLYPDKTHIGVCIGHRFPSVHRNQYEEIEDISRRTARAFDLMNGPFYLQLLIGKEGIRVNELAARIGGAFEDVMIPWVSGFDILGAVMNRALGRPVEAEALKERSVDRKERCCAVLLLFCSPGRIGSVTPLKELKDLPYVLDAGYNYTIGQEIPVMENAAARFGHGVICGDSASIGQRIDDFYSRLSVKSESGEEMLLRFV